MHAVRHRLTRSAPNVALRSAMSFFLPLTDAGAGAVNTAVAFSGGSGAPTFTRATTATTVLSTGLIGSVASGTARSLYSGAGVYLGYLAEPARTNPIVQSQAFAGASWSTQAVTVTDNNAVSPDGTTTAALINDGATGPTVHQLNVTTPLTIVAGTTVTLTAFLKNGTRRYAALGSGDSTARRFYACVDLQTGTITEAQALAGGTYTSSSIQALPNGWYKLQITGKVGAAETVAYWLVAASNSPTPGDSSPSYTGSSLTFFLWGAQIEQAAFATSYIPTTTVAVTRNIDRETYVVSGNLPTNNATVSFQWTPGAAGQGVVYLWGSYVDANNSTAILHDGTNLIFRKRIAAVNTDATIALTYAAGTTYKIAARASSSAGQDIFLSGVKGTNNVTTTAMQLGTNMEFGNDNNGASAQCGSFMQDRIWARALSDVQLVQITL